MAEQLYSAKEAVDRILAECEAGTRRGYLKLDHEGWARCRNYCAVLLAMTRKGAIMSERQAYFLIEKIAQIMRANPDPEHKVVFPGLEDIQLVVYINTAQR